MEVKLRVLKESKKSRFDIDSVRPTKSVSIISHNIFPDFHLHIFFFRTTFLEIAVYRISGK